VPLTCLNTTRRMFDTQASIHAIRLIHIVIHTLWTNHNVGLGVSGPTLILPRPTRTQGLTAQVATGGSPQLLALVVTAGRPGLTHGGGTDGWVLHTIAIRPTPGHHGATGR